MSTHAHPSFYVMAGIAALVAWRLYARVRRMVGRQRLSGVRPWFTVSVFPVLIALLLFGTIGHPPLNTAALLIGVCIGVALGAYGLRLTTFEPTPEGLFYTPNARLGIALSALFILRMGYRAAQVYFAADAGVAAPMEFARSPLTLLIFGMLAGYYVRYAAGLLRWRARVTAGEAGGAKGGAESA